MVKEPGKKFILTLVPNENKIEKGILIHFQPANLGIKSYIANKRLVLSIIATILLIEFFCIINLNPNYPSSISALIVAPISFLLIITVDFYNSVNKKNELLNIFGKELAINLVELLQNNNRIIHELAHLKSGNTGHHRLTKIELNIYELLKQTFPKMIINMNHIETYVSRSKKANESIQFREKLIIHQLDQKEDITMLNDELKKLFTEIIEYICILLDSNLIIAEKYEDGKFRKLSDTKEVINFLDSRIKIYYDPKDPSHSERILEIT